jgi:hypothetical protein
MLQRGETTIGPVAVDGRTITLVARTHALHLGARGRGALHVRARPAHVEVLDGQGRREVVRIHDVERSLIAVIGVAGAVAAIGVRALRKARSA